MPVALPTALSCTRFLGIVAAGLLCTEPAFGQATAARGFDETPYYSTLSNISPNIPVDLSRSAFGKELRGRLIWESPVFYSSDGNFHALAFRIDFISGGDPFKAVIRKSTGEIVMSEDITPDLLRPFLLRSPVLDGEDKVVFSFEGEVGSVPPSVTLTFVQHEALREPEDEERREGVHGSLSWYAASEVDEVAADMNVRGLMRAVARLHVPQRAQCNWGGKEIDDSRGCTAWRFSGTLFATAWHCLPDRQASCQNATLDFGYSGRKRQERPPHKSSDWAEFEETCTSIVYSSKRQDLSIFRVSKANYNKWKGYPVLKILPGSESFPQQTVAEGGEQRRIGDRALVLHYPAPNDRGCVASAGPEYKGYENYQIAVRASMFTEFEADQSCRIIVRGREHASRVKDLGSVVSPLGFDYDPADVCTNKVGSVQPTIGLVHRCDTCGGSSGAPIVSLSPGPRMLTVIGMHLGSPNRDDLGTTGNSAIRMSLVGDCIDFEASQESDQIVFSGTAGQYPYCKTETPATNDYLKCDNPDALPPAEARRCAYYKE